MDRKIPTVAVVLEMGVGLLVQKFLRYKVDGSYGNRLIAVVNTEY